MGRLLAIMLAVGTAMAVTTGCEDPRKGACLDACKTNEAATQACNNLEREDNKKHCLEQLEKNEKQCKDMCNQSY